MSSLYQQSIPVLIKYLENFAAILEKGRQYADEKGMKHEEMINFRLVADMRGLDYQVYSCCNTAKFVASRLAGLEDVKFPDEEKTFDEFAKRIAKTIELLRGVDASLVDGKEAHEVILDTAMGKFQFTGQRYITEFAIPNFHFHLTSAYCILRHLGVPLGALDYLRGVMVKAEE